MTWTTITKDPAYAEWMETLKPSTELGYRSGIMAICRFYKVKPLDMRGWDSTTANDKLKQFVLYLKRNAKPYGGKRRDGEFSVNSIPTYFYAIINFFEHFDIEVKTKKLAKMIPGQVEGDLRPYRREEIAKLLSLAKPRERVIIITPEACGAREGGLAEFEIRHISLVDTDKWSLKPLFDNMQNKVPIPPGTIGMITVYGSSKKAKYISFITYEALKAIVDYLEYRQLHHEKLAPTSPIIRDYFMPLGRNVNHPKKLSPHRVNRIVATLIDRAGVPRDQLQPLHGLRKWFNTAAKNAGIDYMFKEMYMGHTINLDRIYYDTDNPKSLQKMVSEYVKAVDALTINDEYRLKKQVVELKSELRRAAPKDMVYDLAKANKDLRQQMADMQKNFQLILQKIDVSRLE